MSAQQIITQHLDIWTTAHKTRSGVGRGSSNKLDLYGIKKLRELILELAVRGKLVPQDPSDEPASELLNKIAAEKAKLIKEGKIKKEKPLPEITDEEKPFELPSGWEWTKFYKLPYSYSVGLDRGKNEQGNDKAYRYFRMNNILNAGGFSLADIVRVNASEDEVIQFSLTDGDFLFNTRNSKELVGKTCVFKAQDSEPVLYNNNILRAKFKSSLIASFTDLWMRSIQGQYELEKIKSGTTNVWAIYQGKLEELACPIPPLAEQHRIVTKVDELMALCDTLKTNLQNVQTTQLALADALVEQAVN